MLTSTLTLPATMHPARTLETTLPTAQRVVAGHLLQASISHKVDIATPTYQPAMTAVELRSLPARNLWSRQQCLLARVDLGEFAHALTTDLPGFTDALLSIYPSLSPFAAPMRQGCFVAEVIVRLTLELQVLAGAAPFASTAVAMHTGGHHVTLIVACDQHLAARRAIVLALGVVDALGAGLRMNSAGRLPARQAAPQRSADLPGQWQTARQHTLQQRPPASDIVLL